MNVDMKIAMERLQEMDSLPAVLKPSDVAKALGVSRNTAYETVHSTGFPSFKVGKQYRVRLDWAFLMYALPPHLPSTNTRPV